VQRKLTETANYWNFSKYRHGNCWWTDRQTDNSNAICPPFFEWRHKNEKWPECNWNKSVKLRTVPHWINFSYTQYYLIYVRICTFLFEFRLDFIGSTDSLAYPMTNNIVRLWDIINLSCEDLARIQASSKVHLSLKQICKTWISKKFQRSPVYCQSNGRENPKQMLYSKQNWRWRNLLHMSLRHPMRVVRETKRQHGNQIIKTVNEWLSFDL
jgi:hypothetical protein